METITCGVPKGSTLGPIGYSCSILFQYNFSDDTNIFFNYNNAKEVEFTMNEELKLVLKYFAINKLSVNLKKINYFMLITSSKKKVLL